MAPVKFDDSVKSAIVSDKAEPKKQNKYSGATEVTVIETQQPSSNSAATVVTNVNATVVEKVNNNYSNATVVESVKDNNLNASLAVSVGASNNYVNENSVDCRTVTYNNDFDDKKSFCNALSNITELTSESRKNYTVKEKLSDEGGESLVLLCISPNGEDVVSKIYYETREAGSQAIDKAALNRVLEYMKTEDGQKYTLVVIDNGYVSYNNSRFYFEITPYCTNGDMSTDKALSFDEIEIITKQLNNALHSFDPL
jgi:predicted lactoylglutathione lyase